MCAEILLDSEGAFGYNVNHGRKAARRCDGMADVTDSKSVELITRVGSSPTAGTKKQGALQMRSFLIFIKTPKVAFSEGGLGETALSA